MSSVRIVRDVDGVPHIRAEDPTGAFFGQGYAAAHDRLWQMEYDRRRATGTLANLVGRRGTGTDVLHRRLGVGRAARADYEALTSEARAALDAYADGVNAYIAGLDPSALPPELEIFGVVPDPWEPWHSIGVFKVRHLLMGTYEVKLWRSGLVRNLGADVVAALWPDEPQITIVESADNESDRSAVRKLLASAAAALGQIPGEEAASNNVVVHGSRTGSGMPLVAGDSHRAMDLPNTYWQNHIKCPEFDAIGLSFPGVPGFPHFGHNEHVAWCITHGAADDQDVYVERLRRSADGVEYEFGGKWRRAETRSEEVASADARGVAVDIIETEHGPVVAGGPDLGFGLVLRWTALAERDTTFDALVPMLRAETAAELDEAMRPWVAPVNNVVFADRLGSVAYRLRGRLAIRPPANGWTAVPGWAGDHEWSGWVDYDDQPHSFDPERGFFVTANNRQSGGGPYVGNDFSHPARARRLTAIVEGATDWTADGLVSALGDTESLVARRFVEGLLAVRPRHPVERTAQEALRSWDFSMDVDSPAAAIYASCRAELLRVVSGAVGMADDSLGALAAGPTLYQTSRFLWTRIVYLAGARDDSLLAGCGGWAGAYRSALRWGVRALEARLGTDVARWRWGDLHTVRWVHPLVSLRPDLRDQVTLPRPVEVGGDADCVRASGIAPPGLEAVTGSVNRYVFDLADWDQSRWIVPNGVSGDPGSSHWDDQLDDWASVRTRPMRYSDAAVDASVESTITITAPATPRGDG